VPPATSTPPRSPAALLASAWPVRLAWFVLPLLAGPGLADALDERSGAVQLVAQAGLWAWWAVGLVATLVPATVSLTALRSIAPASVAAVVLAAGTAGEWGASVLAALAAAVLATLVAFLPTTGDVMINGSAYGPERRMALRAPASLVIGPIEAVWLLVFAGAVTGPLLLAAGNRVFGLPATVAGVAAVVLGSRSLHRLSRRWVVFVPAGFVLHDHYTLAESLLMRRADVAGLAPAPKDLVDAIDLTAGAAGLALQVELSRPARIAVWDERRRITDREVDRLVFTPSLPGVLLREAEARGLAVGQR
jgi:hypothetical protein